jgi:hypothetical protein
MSIGGMDPVLQSTAMTWDTSLGPGDPLTRLSCVNLWKGCHESQSPGRVVVVSHQRPFSVSR